MILKLKSLFSAVFQFSTFLVIFLLLNKKCICNSQMNLIKKPNFALVPQIHCFALSPSGLKINKCLLKPINRTIKMFYGNFVLLKALRKNVIIHFRVLKKALGGFKPFGIDATLDGCKYMEGKKNLAFDWFFKMVFPYTNVNHTCPYEKNSELIVEYPVKQVLFPSVFPTGEYRIESKFDANGGPFLDVHVYMDLKEN